MLFTPKQKDQFLSSILSHMVGCAIVLLIMTYFEATNSTKLCYIAAVTAHLLLKIILAIWPNKRNKW